MEQQKNNNFDGLRLFAAFLVLLSHQFAIVGQPEPSFLGANLGAIGVLIFFSISGFLVAASWRSDPSVVRYVARRALRIWPAMAVSVVVCIAYVVIFIIPPARRELIPEVISGLSSNFYFVWRDADFFQNNPEHFINGSIWTIPIEVQCYVVLACIGVMARKYLRISLIAFAAFVLGVYCLNLWPANAFGLPEFFQVVNAFNFPVFFLVGTVISVVPAMQTSRGVAGAVMLGLVCAFGGFAGLAWALVLPAGVIYIGNKSLPLLRDAGRFGDLSYGIYLWAWPVQQIGFATLGKHTPFIALLCVTLAAAILLSLGSWHFIEKPSLRLKPVKRSNIADRAVATSVQPVA
jgi:peptidoglycan/LPS O-acetylase OafA/YrhL